MWCPSKTTKGRLVTQILGWGDLCPAKTTQRDWQLRYCGWKPGVLLRLQQGDWLLRYWGGETGVLQRLLQGDWQLRYWGWGPGHNTVTRAINNCWLDKSRYTQKRFCNITIVLVVVQQHKTLQLKYGLLRGNFTVIFLII